MNRSCIRTCFVVHIIALFVAINALAVIPDKTSTGFIWPTGSEDYRPGRCGTWLGRDSGNGGCYDRGLYHIAVDMLAPEGSPVYAIADGEISLIHTSDASWGPGNFGVFIKHQISDGTYFLALYGHIRPFKKDGDSVTAGEHFATIGPYPDSQPHLHLGIVPGTVIPPTDTTQHIGWGRMGNDHWPKTNGFVDPVDWITTHTPYNNNALPSAVTLLSPLGITTTSTPTYTWHAVNATWYYLSVDAWDGSSWRNVIGQWYEAPAICSGETCSVTYPISLTPGDYYWQLLGWNPNGYGPWTGMSFKISSNLDQQAQQDMANRVVSDTRFGIVILGTFDTNLSWDPSWELRWVNFNFTVGRIVTMYHVTHKLDLSLRYVIFWDPDTNSWNGWTRVE